MGNRLACCYLRHSSNDEGHHNPEYNNLICDKRTYSNSAQFPTSDRHAKYKHSSGTDNLEDGLNARTIHRPENLQHISEREPDDIEQDPSNNPTKESIFLNRSRSAIEKSNVGSRRRSVFDRQLPTGRLHLAQRGLHPYSSCSSVLLDDSTVSQPNLKAMIRALSLAVHVNIKNRRSQRSENLVDSELNIFDETVHPLHQPPPTLPVPNSSLEVQPLHSLQEPDQRQIYRFVRTLFSAAQLTAECAVVTLVYLERLLTYAELELAPRFWRRCLLGAVLLASKVWDDQAVWNVDYCQILKDMRVDDVNELERCFLELVQFNINVPSSVYAKYYFDLRSLLASHEMATATRPLSKQRAFKLEGLQRVLDCPFRDLIGNSHVLSHQTTAVNHNHSNSSSFNKSSGHVRHVRRRCCSLDSLTTPPIFNRAIIS